jgi:hypothetical protein
MAKLKGMPPCVRIEWLTTGCLEKIAASNWTILFRDPEDGRYWELTYPKGELQGGGPPRLTVLSPEKAHAKYQLSEPLVVIVLKRFLGAFLALLGGLSDGWGSVLLSLDWLTAGIPTRCSVRADCFRVLLCSPNLAVVLSAAPFLDTAQLRAVASFGLCAFRSVSRRGGILGGIVLDYLGTRFK